MADCNKLFQTFNLNISLTSGKRDRMTKSKDGLRERIRKHFKENHAEYNPKFFIQGSYKMNVGIRTKEDICDLDDGVYFFREPDVSSTTLQGWIMDAVDGYTDMTPEHRIKCIRNIFSGDYEIDLPVYYKVDGTDYQLAIKNNGWEFSDPKALVDWFNNKKDKTGQLLGIVKYLKAWCDHKGRQMPNGLAMTILATNAKARFYYNDRDDITLRDTLKEIFRAVNNAFVCYVPVIPNDELFAGFDDSRKNNFLGALSDFINDANSALRETNQLKASRLWKKHLGNRFPEGIDKEEDNSLNISLILGAKPSNPWAQ